MKGMFITASAAALLLLQGAAGAQEQTPTAGQQDPAEGIPATRHQQQAVEEISDEDLQRLDEDRDGQISRDEAQAESRLSENWDRLDQNRDGRLDQEEVAALNGQSQPSGVESAAVGAGPAGETGPEVPVTEHQSQAVHGDILRELDQDQDGQISQQEAEGQPQLSSNWDQLDQNDDGVLDTQELVRYGQLFPETEEAE